VDVKLIGIDCTLHHHLAQPPGCGDEYHILKARFGIQRKHHPRRTCATSDHALNTRRKRYGLVGIALVHAIGNCPIVIKRGKYVARGLHDIFQAMDVEKSLLLPGKRRVRHVFGGCAGAHRYRSIAIAHHGFISAADLVSEFLRVWRLQYPATDLRPDFCKGLDIVHIQSLYPRVDTLLQPVLCEKVLIRKRRCRKTARNANAHPGKLPDHFAERCIFATNCLDVTHSYVLQINDVLARIHHFILVACRFAGKTIFYPLQTARAAIRSTRTRKCRNRNAPFSWFRTEPVLPRKCSDTVF
jgi:hypothetical protein